MFHVIEFSSVDGTGKIVLECIKETGVMFHLLLESVLPEFEHYLAI
jgi:hypothetical protein